MQCYLSRYSKIDQSLRLGLCGGLVLCRSILIKNNKRERKMLQSKNFKTVFPTHTFGGNYVQHEDWLSFQFDQSLVFIFESRSCQSEVKPSEKRWSEGHTHAVAPFSRLRSALFEEGKGIRRWKIRHGRSHSIFGGCHLLLFFTRFIFMPSTPVLEESIDLRKSLLFNFRKSCLVLGFYLNSSYWNFPAPETLTSPKLLTILLFCRFWTTPLKPIHSNFGYIFRKCF